MKIAQYTELQHRLKQEALHPDTIFLHKSGKGWAAFGNSAVLLQHYFAPVWLRMSVVGRDKIPYATWHGTISPRKSSEELAFEFSCNTSDQMTIRCPKPLMSKPV